MIKRTVGNTQQVVVPLYTRTLHEDGTVSVEAYTPSADDVVTASLAGKRVYNYPTTIGEGCIIFSIIGVEVADVYALRVLVVKADGSRMRYYTENAIELTHETIEDDEQGAEFTASGIVLDAAYYLFAKGDKGDTGNGIDRIELTRTSVDGKRNTYTIYYTDGRRYSYTIDNGADGKGIDHIAKTATEGLVDTYTIYYTDGTTSTYQVTNGQGGGTVDAYTKAEADARFAKSNDATQDIKARGIRVDVLSFEDGSLNTSNGNLIYDGDKVITEGDAVPLTRKVNGQPLTADITLDGNNINATLGEATTTINNVIEFIGMGINMKQDALVSGDNIKTINGESILGSGDIVVEGGTEEIYIGTGTPPEDAKIAINPNENFVSIEQTTGQSTTSVMSQKAVTDALAGAWGWKASVVLRPFDDVQTAYNMTAMDFATGTFTIDGTHNIAVGDMVTIIPNFKVSRVYSNMVTQRLNRMVSGAYPCAAVTGVDGNNVVVEGFINASQSALTANQWLIVKRSHSRVIIELPDYFKHKEISVRIQGFTTQTTGWNNGTIDVIKGTVVSNYTNKITADCGHGSYLDELCEFYMDRAIRYDMAAICRMDTTGSYRTNYVVVQGNSYNMADTDHIWFEPNLCVYGNYITIKEL